MLECIERGRDPLTQGVFPCTTMFDRLEATERRYDELTAEMAKPEISGDYGRLQVFARERSSIEAVTVLYRACGRSTPCLTW